MTGLERALLDLDVDWPATPDIAVVEAWLLKRIELHALMNDATARP